MSQLGFQAPDIDPDADERDCQVASGYHMATTERAHVDKDGRLNIVWRIESAPWAGHVIADKYLLPSMCMTQEALPECIRRYWIVLYRLGLVTKEQRGQPINLELPKLLGIRRVLHVKREPSKKNPTDPKLWSNIVYGAIWSTDRPEIPVEDRIRLGLPLLAGQTPPKLFDTPPAVVTPPVPVANPGGIQSPPAMAFDPSEV
jgi:hypothetical protein